MPMGGYSAHRRILRAARRCAARSRSVELSVMAVSDGDHPRHTNAAQRFSRMATATTTPEANVIAAIARIAAVKPKRSAMTPAESAPTA